MDRGDRGRSLCGRLRSRRLLGLRSLVGLLVVLELFVGERPGGMVGGVLLIEQEGVDYAQAADGTTVLPVFAVRPLAETVKLDLAEAAYPMSVDSPRFNAKPRNVAAATQGDVVVDVNI